MKKKLILFLLAAVAVGAQAQNTLNVIRQDGSFMCFRFSEKPQTTFEGNDVVITTDKQNLKIPFSTIKEYTFGDDLIATDVISMQAADSGLGTVYVYSINGILIKTIGSSNNKSVEIFTKELPAGTYIIKNNNVTYKYQKQ